jgi:hypothetical protein
MVWSPLVDHLVDPTEGPVSAHDIMVLIGWCKNNDHLAWIMERGLYNFRVGTGVKGGIDQIEPQFAQARMIVLHDDSGALPGVWKVRSSGVQLCTQDELKGYPSPGHRKYAVFGVEQLPQYTMRWNKVEMGSIRPELNDPAQKGVPIILSLAEFLRASPMTPLCSESYR